MLSISLACHQGTFLAMARKITSCTFIARFTAALGYVSTLACMDTSSPPDRRTLHLLIEPDISSANDTCDNAIDKPPIQAQYRRVFLFPESSELTLQ
jgi:hypothetical protein